MGTTTTLQAPGTCTTGETDAIRWFLDTQARRQSSKGKSKNEIVFVGACCQSGGAREGAPCAGGVTYQQTTKRRANTAATFE